ncbi:MAG TPA: glycosyltransferase, partial [Acidimicrobiales bacterium]
MADVGRPLRVAHLTTVDMSLALLLGTELAVDVAEGFEVFGISAPGPYVERIEALGVTHVPIPELTRSWDLRADAAAVRRLAGTLRALRLDVLHTHTPKAGVLGRVLGRVARVPVVVNTCHGLWVREDDSTGRKALVYGVEAVAAAFSHVELYQNDVDRRALRWSGRPSRRLTVGNGVDLTRFQFDEDGRRRVRAEHGITADELVVGGVGRRVDEKGIAEFGAAARALAGRARFVWVGPDDPDKADPAAGDEPGIDFWGARDDM